MSDVAPIDGLIAANERYAATFAGSDLTARPVRRLIVVTCMDARIDPLASLGLTPGDAHIIRNAGASARDALRSIIVSQRMLDTISIALIKHTGCGMQCLDPAMLESRLAEIGAASVEMDWHEFTDLDQAVRDDLEFLRTASQVVAREIRGFVYDPPTGRLREIN